MGSWFVNQILGALLGLVFGGVESLWDLLSVSFLVSPDVTALPQVRTVMNTSLIVVNTCYGLAVIAAGLTVMTHGTVQIRYAVGDLLPRLVVGFIAANFAGPAVLRTDRPRQRAHPGAHRGHRLLARLILLHDQYHW